MMVAITALSTLIVQTLRVHSIVPVWLVIQEMGHIVKVSLMCKSVLCKQIKRILSGYSRTLCDVPFGLCILFSDIDECTNELDGCHHNATCSNNGGSYSCSCNPGYTGNGTYCRGINKINKFRRLMGWGWWQMGSSRCIISETEVWLHAWFILKHQNDAGQTELCRPEISKQIPYEKLLLWRYRSYDVPLRYYRVFIQRAQKWFSNDILDIDECAAGGSHNCHPDATCHNNIGSFYCICNTGYTGTGTGCQGLLTSIYKVL